MKNGLMVGKTLRNGTDSGIKNMGDYIQSLAGEIFFDTIDEYIDREKLAEYKSASEKTRMIMNGWYMWFPENWPPSDDIFPLLISMHICPFTTSKMLSIEGVNYFKKHAPVGCRDKYTENLLKQHDIPCYFSGCLTLVLGEKFKTQKKINRIIFVDPYFEVLRIKGRKSIFNLMKVIYYGIMNFKKVNIIKKHFYDAPVLPRKKIYKTIKKFLNVSAFYKTYSSYFDDKVLFNADYITHSVRTGANTAFVSEKEKLDYARILLHKYAEASLVVTSRIHCALPCLGLETPVLFVSSDYLEDDKNLRPAKMNRFNGLINLLRVMKYKNFALSTDDNTIKKKITTDTIIVNKKDYIPIKELLLNKCNEFISNC